MATPIETVSDFLKGWDRPGGFRRQVEAYFQSDAIWENVGLSTTTGPEQAASMYDAMGGGGDPPLMKVEVLAIAAAGDTVLTERIDYILSPDGAPARTFKVMGAFDIREGKIAAWRDCFDTAGMVAQG